MAGKGDKRRTEDYNAVTTNWDEIDWGKDKSKSSKENLEQSEN